MKKLLSIICAIIILTIAFSSAIYAAGIDGVNDSITHIDLEQETDVNKLTITAGSGKCGDDMQWSLSQDGTLTISGTGDMYTYVDSEAGKISIPWFGDNNSEVIKAVVVENGVNSISEMAFYGTSITSIVLPKSVTSIGSASIANCKKLTNIVLSDNIEIIPDGAFNSDETLETIYLPEKLKRIEEGAFIHCYKLQNIAIPETVEEIRDMAFFDCPLISNAVIPENVTTIKYGVFKACLGLKSVVFPPALKEIEETAFSNCANIEKTILPDGLEKIGRNAFSYSAKDRNADLPKQIVYVPESVKQIDKNGIDDNSVIYGFKGSEAEKYAKDNKIKFVEVTDSMYNEKDYNTAKQQHYSLETATIQQTTSTSETPKPTGDIGSAYEREISKDATVKTYHFSDGSTVTAVANPGYDIRVTDVSFDDLPSGDGILTKAVNYLYDEGIVNGYAGNVFMPDGDITRAEIAKMLNAASENKSNDEKTYTDVNESHWAYNYIKRSLYFEGYEDGSFKPEGKITYGEVVTAIVRFAGLENQAKGSGLDYPQNYIKTATDNDITYGITVNADIPATRGDVAIMLYNAITQR